MWPYRGGVLVGSPAGQRRWSKSQRDTVDAIAGGFADGSWVLEAPYATSSRTRGGARLGASTEGLLLSDLVAVALIGIVLIGLRPACGGSCVCEAPMLAVHRGGGVADPAAVTADRLPVRVGVGDDETQEAGGAVDCADLRCVRRADEFEVQRTKKYAMGHSYFITRTGECLRTRRYRATACFHTRLPLVPCVAISQSCSASTNCDCKHTGFFSPGQCVHAS